MEATADNSVGNVTGSNSVNVFLGLGLPWTLAAIYHYVVNDVRRSPIIHSQHRLMCLYILVILLVIFDYSAP